jgi:hypothetical protein
MRALRGLGLAEGAGRRARPMDLPLERVPSDRFYMWIGEQVPRLSKSRAKKEG